MRVAGEAIERQRTRKTVETKEKKSGNHTRSNGTQCERFNKYICFDIFLFLDIS